MSPPAFPSRHETPINDLEGGFTAQGSAGIAPALEFPFGRVFQRLTGDSHPARVDFEGALANARMWSQFSAQFAALTLTGSATLPPCG